MIPMPMAPYDGINFLVIHTTLTQKLVDIFENVESRYTCFDCGDGGWGKVPPIFPAS